MNATSLRIPTPVGGTPLTDDGAPSALFAALYGILFPFFLMRLVSSAKRNSLLMGSTAFSIERVVIYGLRASQSFHVAKHASSGLLTYFQLSFGEGFMSIANDTVPLLRVLIVRATNPPDQVGDAADPEVIGTPSQAVLRAQTRRATDFMRLFFLVATILNIVSGFTYKDALTDQSAADRVMNLRYAATALSVVLTSTLVVWTCLARSYVANVRRAACDRLLTIYILLLTVGIYRLGVMHFRIPNLLSTDGWESQEAPAAKALFYVFHALPEWAASALLQIPNTRALFGSGQYGDWHSKDGQLSCTERMKNKQGKLNNLKLKNESIELSKV